MNLYRKILEEIGDYAGPAVIDRGRTSTYPDLFRRTGLAAERLRRLGVVPGANVAILADDSLEYIVLSLAVLSLDAAIVPVSSRATEEETESILREMRINFLICTEPYRKPGDMEFPGTDCLYDRCYIRTLDPKIEPVALPGGRTAAFIRFSSGTTGKNKGVVLSHESVIGRTDACEELGVTRGENVFWVLDMAFHFVVTILLFLRKGACIVICPPPVEANMADVLRDHPVQLLYATPYHYKLMTASGSVLPEYLSHVRRAFSTAMKLTPADAAAFRAKFGHPLTQAYGIIEVGLPCVNNSGDPEKAPSVGRLQPAYRLMLKDADPETGAGRILLRGPGFFEAYLSPFRTRDEVCEDGYFDTGDIGYVDPDGYLFITARAKNLINFSGMKIFPYEVENVLLEHPWVRDCRVSGRPAGSFGEVPEAEIVLAEGLIPPDEWVQVLREFCYRKLASYKVPKFFQVVSSLPRTASGKLIRKK